MCILFLVFFEWSKNYIILFLNKNFLYKKIDKKMDIGQYRPLNNCSNCCFANATFQLMLHIGELNGFFYSLDENDNFRKFFDAYFSTANNHALNTKIYKNLSFWRSVVNGYDIDSFLHDICIKYPQLYSYFGIKVRALEDNTPIERTIHMISINQETTVQEGINRTIQRLECLDFKRTLFIGISRFLLNNEGVSVLIRRPVKLNQYVKLTYGDNIKYYKLKGLVIHTGNNDHHGHFQAISYHNQDIYYCNDLTISKNARFRNITNSQIENHATLLVYIET